MKNKLMILAACAGALGAAGCASNERGGTTDEYSTGFGMGIYATPEASPTVRPGSTPLDIRDPNALATPQPHPLYPPSQPPP
jgi:hypothetical protein